MVEVVIKEMWEVIKLAINHLFNEFLTIINDMVDHANEHADDYTDDELGRLARLAGLKRMGV